MRHILQHGSLNPKLIMVTVIAAFLVLAVSAISLPRLAVEQSLSCKTCHINPNGGGMRTEFGNHAVALHELCLPSTRDLVKDKVKSSRIAENLLVGFDSRYLILDNARVFRMQTDVYLAFNPYPNMYYLLRFWESGISESYALFYLDEDKHYAKFGRFYPAFGLGNADHKAFNRERTGHGSLVYLDGISLGAELAGTNVVAEAFNPNEQGVYGLHLYRPGYFSDFSYLVGFSARFSEAVDDSHGAHPHAKAIFGGLSYDRFTLQGELDLVGKGNDTLITYANLTTRLIYGLYAIGEYNFFDGNRAVADGVDEFVRVSVELFPLPFVEVRPSYTYYTRGWQKNEDDFFLQFHVGF